MADDVLTVTQAAQYLGLTRQAIASAAKRGEIGQKQDALGTRDGWIYVFTRPELTPGRRGRDTQVAAQKADPQP